MSKPLTFEDGEKRVARLMRRPHEPYHYMARLFPWVSLCGVMAVVDPGNTGCRPYYSSGGPVRICKRCLKRAALKELDR